MEESEYKKEQEILCSELKEAMYALNRARTYAKSTYEIAKLIELRDGVFLLGRAIDPNQFKD